MAWPEAKRGHVLKNQYYVNHDLLGDSHRPTGEPALNIAEWVDGKNTRAFVLSVCYTDCMTSLIEQNNKALVELCRRYHVAVLEVFGSAATDDFDEQKSDIDFLVEFDKNAAKNRFDNFFALLDELQKLFGRRIDMVEPGGLKNPYFIETVNRTRKRIYAAT